MSIILSSAVRRRNLMTLVVLLAIIVAVRVSIYMVRRHHEPVTNLQPQQETPHGQAIQ